MNSNTYLDTIGDVIGDVIEPFLPTVDVSVYYDNQKVMNGCELKKMSTGSTPRVVVGGERDEKYSIIMVDPDHPSPNEPMFKDYVLWIVMNIPGGKTCAQGTQVASYVGPDPKVGVHRYMLLLYKQQSEIDEQESMVKEIDILPSRACFNRCDFTTKHKLGKPVGFTYFYVRKTAAKSKA